MYFKTICDERDALQTEMNRVKKELSKTSALLGVERDERQNLENILKSERESSTMVKEELSDKIIDLESKLTIVLRKSNLDRQNRYTNHDWNF